MGYKKINGQWKNVTQWNNANIPAFRDFYMPLGYHYEYRAINAHADFKDIFYFETLGLEADGPRVYTHELTHVADDDPVLLGYMKRRGMNTNYEAYARGLFETNTWSNQDFLSINSIFDYTA